MKLIDADKYAFPGDLINEPTVDAVEVVRCRDCECFDGKRCTHPQWRETRYGVYEDDYCSYGKQRGDE